MSHKFLISALLFFNLPKQFLQMYSDFRIKGKNKARDKSSFDMRPDTRCLPKVFTVHSGRLEYIC